MKYMMLCALLAGCGGLELAVNADGLADKIPDADERADEGEADAGEPVQLARRERAPEPEEVIAEPAEPADAGVLEEADAAPLEADAALPEDVDGSTADASEPAEVALTCTVDATSQAGACVSTAIKGVATAPLPPLLNDPAGKPDDECGAEAYCVPCSPDFRDPLYQVITDILALSDGACPVP